MKRHIHYYFLITVGLLVCFGILFLATLSAPASFQTFGNTNYYVFHQLVALAIGFVLAFIVFKIPIHILKKISPFLLALNIILLLLVFMPLVGVKFLGAKRWIAIGSHTLQPSEFLKITSILYLSALLSSRSFEGIKRGWIQTAKKGYNAFRKLFVPFFILLSIIVAILYFQKDISTLGIVTVSLLAIYFAAETPLWHTLVIIITGISSALVFIRIEPYRIQRLLIFLNPESDPLGTGFHIRQSLIAMGSGGIFGKGLGMSTQKFGFLPEAMSDSVFAILGEELGIIGCTVVIVLFIALFWQGIKIAKSTQDKFSKLACIGIMVWILTQAFMNMASISGIFPLSGIPLPFFSYGGSHLVAEMIGMGIVLNISKHG